MIDFSSWTKATGDLLPGQQAVFLDVLNLVSEGKAHLVYGADYRDGKPCLVNAVGQMLTTGGGEGIPSSNFRAVVAAFDSLNCDMRDQGVNTDGYVSPLAADFLIRNFGEVKEMVVEDVPTSEGSNEQAVYVEPSDTEFMASWLNALSAPAPDEVASTPVGEGTPEVEYVRAHVDFPSSAS